MDNSPSKDVPPGYKRTEVGVIPEDWDLVPFSRLFEFQNGVNRDKEAYGSGVRFINVLEIITKSHLRASDIPGRVSLSPNGVNSFAVRRGDIVFNRTSETQEEVGLASVYLDDEAVVFGGFVIRGRPIHQAELNPEYAGYALRTQLIRQQITARGQGAIRSNIGQADLRQVLAPRPSGAEQRAIASALSDVDELLAALDTLIAKKRAIKQATMQQLLTGKTRLPGFSGEWETKRLGELVDFHKGTGLSKADLTLAGARRCIHYGQLFTTYGARIAQVISGTNSTGAFLYSQPNDVLMPTSDVTPNGLATASCIMISGVILGGDILIIRAPDNVVNGEFLAHAVRMNRKQIMQLISGITVFHLYGRDMANFQFHAPPIAEQTAIAAVLSDMDAELTALERRRDKTKQMKQGMMQQLLTGRIRLV